MGEMPSRPLLSEGELLQINLEGKALEKKGRIEEAIAVYERGIAAKTVTPNTYLRLRILYRRLKRFDDLNRIKRTYKAQFGRSRTG